VVPAPPNVKSLSDLSLRMRILLPAAVLALRL
jgi:hypothetical protein